MYTAFLEPFFDPVMIIRSIGLLQIKFSITASKCTFCGFPWVETSTAGRVYDLCVYYMTGAPEGSPKSGFMWFYGGFFMEKPGIETATPGLQGIALIHYTTGASCHAYLEKGFTVNIQCIIQLSLIYNSLSKSLVPFIYLF